MLVTALTPHIGYDKSLEDRAQSRRRRHHPPALALGVEAAEFDRIVDPKTTVGSPRRDHGLNGAT